MRNEKTYIVKKGDNLYNIANQFKTTVSQLMELNNLQNTILQEGQILIISSGEYISKPIDENYEEFLKTNLGSGKLKVHVLVGNTMLPIKTAKVVVYKLFNQNKKTFFSGFTEESGIIDNIILPAPIKRDDYMNEAGHYQLEISHPNYIDITIEKISIYDDIKSVQKIEMYPSTFPNKKGASYGE